MPRNSAQPHLNSPGAQDPLADSAAPREVTGSTSGLALLYLRVSTSRQAHRGGEAEGYSLPAQREACTRKATELGATVSGEFVDAGASARSADRDGLQALLVRLADKSQPQISYVIVHKLDRLARDRADDVALLLAIQNAGAQLVSVSEQIDETPAGMLLHGIMATMAEFYSRNLSSEAKKGIAEKAKRGGTIGYAPTGYTNTTARQTDETGVSREAKTVIPDAERAPHISWAFETYARGQTSISDLVIQLAARGLTTRDSRATGKPLSRAAVHRMLSNPYYAGKVVHRGVIYDGQQKPLVDQTTFTAVQEMLAGRKIAGDRSWRQHHYLKGTVVCARCLSRLGYSVNRGQGGQYAYFFCLGRAKKRTDCDLPYLPADDVENSVIRLWHRESLSNIEAADTKRRADQHLATMRSGQSRELTSAEREVAKLTTAKKRLLDAYLAEAVSLADFQDKQAEMVARLDASQSRLDLLSKDYDQTAARVDVVLSLMRRAGEFYEKCPHEGRQLLNQAIYRRIRIGKRPSETVGDRTEVVEAVVAPDEPHTGAGGGTAPDRGAQAPAGKHAASNEQGKNPRQARRSDEGSNFNRLAERERFELSVPLLARMFSRHVP